MDKDPQILEEQPHQQNYQDIREQLLKHARSVSPRAEHLVKSVLNYLHPDDSQQAQGQEKIDLQWDYDIESKTISPICTKTVGYNGNTEQVFRCFDCLLTGNAIQCADCFSASDHKGHNYIQFFEGPGCCDCGNSEMWNQKGFCPSHSKRQAKISIEPSKEHLFHREMQLAYWIYFWLNEYQMKIDKSIFQFMESYIEKLMEVSNFIASQNYEYKVLLAELFHSTCSESLPKLKKQNKSILWLVFDLPMFKQEKFKESFLSLTMELFPVQKFRVDMIKIYFEKTKNDEEFNFSHPFRLVNFQFMTCLSTITKLIQNGEIRPIIPFRVTSQTDKNRYIYTFIKHYDDLFYIQQMKKSRDYNLVMMEQNDLSESAYYRAFNNPQVFYSDGNITLDDHYVKIMGLAVKSVADRKDLLQKQMRNLIKYVLDIQIVTSSMAQERLFAMIVTAYFNGDISQLRSKQVAEKFVNMLDIGKQSPQKLKRLILQGLKGIFHSKTQRLMPFTMFYTFQFFQQYDQNQITHHLDLVYHKILFLISKDILDYGQFVEEVMGQIKENELKIVIPEFLMMMKYGDIDELVVSYYLQMGNQEKLMAFYASLVEANKQKHGKDIKHIAGNIISRLKQFEMFIKKRTKIDQKGKVQNIIATQPLATCIYQALFDGGSLDVYPDHIPTSEIFDQLPIFTQKLLSDYKRSLLQTMTIYTSKMINQRIYPFCRMARTLIKYYLMEESDELGDFFIESILPFCLQKGYTHLSGLINRIFKSKISSEERENQKHDVDEAQKKRKQRIAKLKKQKEQKMRKQQEIHLSMHKDLQQSSSEEIQADVCILCREDRQNEPLHLISSVDVSDIIEKSVLKIEGSHIVIRTCGHKIHHKCFFENNKNNFYRCFLCKRSTNILIPDYSSSTVVNSELPKEASQFMEKIYLTLLQYRADIDAPISALMTKVKYNIFTALLQSFLYEIISIEFQEESHFKRYVLPAYKAIFNLARNIDNELKTKASNQQYEISQEQMKGVVAKPVLRYTNSKIIWLLGEKEPIYEDLEPKQAKDVAILKKIDHIFDILNGTASDFSINDAQTKLTGVRREELFYPIPQELTQLHTKRGECPQCHKFSSQILLCLQCGWRCCWDESETIGNHPKTCHLNGCAFIRCYDGRVVYVYDDKALTTTTIFENYLGQPFTYEKEMQNVHKFRINRGKLEEVHRHIFNSEIREKVKY